MTDQQVDKIVTAIGEVAAVIGLLIFMIFCMFFIHIVFN